MKKLSALFLLALSLILSAQDISIKDYPKIDSANIQTVLQKISPQLIQKYQNSDKATYLDNLFRLQMMAGKFPDAMNSIRDIRNMFKSNPTTAAVMGIQFELYMNTLNNPNSKENFSDTYIKEFHKKFNTLTPKAQVAMSSYFGQNLSLLKTDILNSIKKDFNDKETVSIETAVALSRKYNSYLVGSKSYLLALNELKKQNQLLYEVKDSLVLKTKSGHEITAVLVLNKKATHPEATILVNNIYANLNGAAEAKAWASYGYHCIQIYTRGKYLSQDTVEPFEHEAEDIYDIIDWISKQPWSNGKVGMIGGSYLGFSQWAATKKLHPALKTIIPQVAVGIGIDYPMSNNVFMSYMLRWLDFVTSNKLSNDASFRDDEKWNQAYKKWYTSGASFNQLDDINGLKSPLFQKWLQHPDFDGYWSSMIPYKKEFQKINIPVLTTTGYFDDDQLGALYYFKNHLKYLPNANHYLVIGPYDHAGGQGSVRDEIQGYKIDDAAKIDFDELCKAWFDFTMKNKPKPLFLKDKINYQVMGTNQWKSASSLNVFDNNKVKFYLLNNLNLSPTPKSPLDFTTLKVDLKNRNDADEILNYEYGVVSKKLLNTGNLIEFKTDIFNQDVEFTGFLSGKLNFAINKKDVDLVLYLYEKRPNGDYHWLSYYIGRASYALDNETRKLIVPNQKTIIPIRNASYTSKVIKKGSQLVLLVGVNKSPQWQINYGTGKDVSSETIHDAQEPIELKFYQNSYIELPAFK